MYNIFYFGSVDHLNLLYIAKNAVVFLLRKLKKNRLQGASQISFCNAINVGLNGLIRIFTDRVTGCFVHA